LRLYDREAENRRLRDELRATRVDEALRRGAKASAWHSLLGKWGFTIMTSRMIVFGARRKLYSVFGVAADSFTPTMAA
jgi:hypothetical protein